MPDVKALDDPSKDGKQIYFFFYVNTWQFIPERRP